MRGVSILLAVGALALALTGTAPANASPFDAVERLAGEKAAAVALARPGPEAGDEAWDDYLHLRYNPAGVTRDVWYHEAGCGAWMVVTRNTINHEVLGSELVAKKKEA